LPIHFDRQKYLLSRQLIPVSLWLEEFDFATLTAPFAKSLCLSITTEKDVAEILSLSLVVREQLCVDGCARTVVLRDGRIEAAGYHSLS
jgi:hypothetical protein